jgi:hypothetical protein
MVFQWQHRSSIPMKSSPVVWSVAQNDEACVDRYALQLSLGVVDIVTDMAVVILAYYTMRGVQITTRRRASIVALFGLRLLYVSKHSILVPPDAHTDFSSLGPQYALSAHS